MSCALVDWKTLSNSQECEKFLEPIRFDSKQENYLLSSIARKYDDDLVDKIMRVYIPKKSVSGKCGEYGRLLLDLISSDSLLDRNQVIKHAFKVLMMLVKFNMPKNFVNESLIKVRDCFGFEVIISMIEARDLSIEFLLKIAKMDSVSSIQYRPLNGWKKYRLFCKDVNHMRLCHHLRAKITPEIEEKQIFKTLPQELETMILCFTYGALKY